MKILSQEDVAVLESFVDNKGCVAAVRCPECPIDARNGGSDRCRQDYLEGPERGSFYAAKGMLEAHYSKKPIKKPRKPASKPIKKPRKPASKPINLGVEWEGVVYTESKINGSELQIVEEELAELLSGRDAINKSIRAKRLLLKRHGRLLEKGDLT